MGCGGRGCCEPPVRPGPVLSHPLLRVPRGPHGGGKSATSRHCRLHLWLQSSGAPAGPALYLSLSFSTRRADGGLQGSRQSGSAASAQPSTPRPGGPQPAAPAMASPRGAGVSRPPPSPLRRPSPAPPRWPGGRKAEGSVSAEARPWRVQAPIRAHMASGTSALCPGSRQPFLPGREARAPGGGPPLPHPSSGPGGARGQVAASGPLPSGVAQRSPTGKPSPPSSVARPALLWLRPAQVLTLPTSKLGEASGLAPPDRCPRCLS